MSKSVILLRVKETRHAVIDRWDALDVLPHSIVDDAGNTYIMLGDRDEEIALWLSWQHKEPTTITLTFKGMTLTRDAKDLA